MLCKFPALAIVEASVAPCSQKIKRDHPRLRYKSAKWYGRKKLWFSTNN